MARLHPMPPDTREKEKIVGGILEIGQVLWLVAGAGIGAVMVIATFRVLSGFAFILLIPPIAVSVPFAFKKVGDMSYAKYLRYRRKFKNMKKQYVNWGTHTELEFSGYIETQEG